MPPEVDEVQGQDQTQLSPEESEAQALAEAIAGYDKARGAEPPAVEEPDTPNADQQAEPQTQPPTAETKPEAESGQTQQPNITELADELKALKEKVKGSSGDAETIRKMHGEIGNINRTLQQLQNAKTPAEQAPAKDELAAALDEAEKTAEEFPELAGPLVKAIKTLKARIPDPQEKGEPVDVKAEVLQVLRKEQEQDALTALKAEHPDYVTLRATEGYKAWLATKTPAFQEMFNSTWNAAVVSKGLTECKDWLKTQQTKAPQPNTQRKQQRLESAVTPTGVPAKAQPSTLPDDEGFNVGYYGRPARR